MTLNFLEQKHVFLVKLVCFNLVGDDFPKFNITVYLNQVILNRFNKEHLTGIKSASTSSFYATYKIK
ncbi:MAG TPA: hypothetical protein DEF48_10670 [Nostoc sp. UBA8866]|uniref:Uncharacterized protein n=1 Tax=Trichormus variabilis NIES-23 TaxID=1973479 RepID=A0A1Z4KHL1_ANAVA|nr:hypothetical protein DSM107007_07010 [Nostoc sp. PCC 7120 = FACHB-418]BAY68480.1 hypothetical protein NIES23_12660 [Trichormus variabilis NIES-23]HBW30529.1 hypothetical protein [Nostoc sp. UBA8866]